ncbi:MAG: sigma-70 family RNA polymerase sigma factor [Planctomycetes bacterium]|nr:sigma-70 family RNA polymerase sigma factor [Planctomycetota bacterium]
MADSPSLEHLFAAFVDTGCEDSLQQLLRRCAPPLRRSARQLGASIEDAEDLVQETLVAALAIADRWDRRQPLLPWLQELLTRHRSQQQRERVPRSHEAGATAEAEAGPRTGPDAATAAEQRELSTDLQKALANLPPRYRDPLRRYLLDQHSPRQIARDLQQPRTTVRVHLHRGLRQLREALKRWSAPLFAWLLVRPGTAGTGAAPRRAALALPLLGALALCWYWWQFAGTAGDRAVPVAVAAPATEATAPPGTAPAPEPPPAADRTAVASAPATAVLTIQVEDLAGQGVPAVGITCTRIDGGDPLLHRSEGVTDAHGRLHFALPPSGRFALQADRGPRIAFDQEPKSRTFRLVLKELGTVRGRVRLADGTPAGGASIWVGSVPAEPWRGQDVIRTGDDGTFELTHIADATFVAARHPDWCGSNVERWDVGHDGTLELNLGPAAGRAVLRITDADGRAVAGANVWAGDTTDGVPLHLIENVVAWRPPPQTGRSDAEGRLALASLPPGPLPLMVRARGFAPEVDHIHVVAAQEVSHTIVLRAQPPLRGRVLDAEGRGIDGARIVCRADELGGNIDALTGADGSFEFVAPPAPPLELMAHHEGHLPHQLRLVTAPKEAIELVLPTAQVVTGIVRGLPPADAAAELRATWSQSALKGEPRLVSLQADGSFTCTANGLGRPQLAIQLPGEPLWRDLDPFSTWDGAHVVVQLPAQFAASAILQGVLRTAAGAPLAQARLFVQFDGRAADELGLTDDRGAFRLGPLPLARFELYAETTRLELPSWWLGAFELAAGEEHSIDRSAPPTGTLQLDLGAEDGAEPGPMVLVIRDVAADRRAAMPQSPRAHQVLLPGDYQLFAVCDRLRWVEAAPVHIDAGAVTTLRLRLPRATRCTLRVHGLPEPGSGPRRFELHDLDRGELYGDFKPAAHTALRFQAVLQAGRYELRHTDAEGRAWRGPFVVAHSDAAMVIPVPMQH